MKSFGSTVLALILLLASSGAACASALSDAPAGLAFYTPPSPLPPGKHGDVIWARPWTAGSALSNAARNWLVLYHTTTAAGRDVAVSGTVSIPPGAPPPGGWPTVSWAHGTTGNAPQCAPSRYAQPDGEQRLMKAWIARGYAVAQTDYEGQGTPGIHPYFIATAAAHDVTDIVRAARILEPQIGTRWLVLGHSEGGTASLSTASLGQAWAPELRLMGAVSYAPGSQITSFLDGAINSSTPSSGLPMLGLMLESFAANDPAVHLDRILTPGALAALPALQERCITNVNSDARWAPYLLTPKSMFLEHADIMPLAKDFEANEPGSLHITLPVLLVQGTADSVVPATLSMALAQELCQAGTPVRFEMYRGKDHGTAVTETADTTLHWTDAVLAGTQPRSNCGEAPLIIG